MRSALGKMSVRERRLATLTAGLLVAAGMYVVGMAAVRRLAVLDATIEGLEQDLVRYSREAARNEAVDRAFRNMESQHSSQWTQAEIHDRLRQEIHRLSRRQVPPPGSAAPGGEQLIDIPVIQSGKLSQSGEGYREYQISVKPGLSPMANIALFLQRLEESPQVLRIDSLDLVRQPASDLVSASLTVTRTVVGEPSQQSDRETASGPAEVGTSSGNLARNANFEVWDAAQSRFPEWESEGCTLASDGGHATAGQACLCAQASATGAAVFQRQQLQVGKVYELVLDAAVRGPAELGVVVKGSGELSGSHALTDDGLPYRYRFRFALPASSDREAAAQAPYIRLKSEGASVFVDNVVLAEVAE